MGGTLKAVCDAQVGWGSAELVALVMEGGDRCLGLGVAVGEMGARAGAEAGEGLPERPPGSVREAGW